MLANELKSKINKLWDKFWSGGIANPLTAIEQMSYLIFMKRLEEEDNKRVRRSKVKDDEYTSIFEGEIEINGKKINRKNCRWSEWKNLPADEMLEHVRDNVFLFLKNLHNGNEGSFFAKHMKDAVFLIPKPSLLQEAVAIIDEIQVEARNIDTQGDIYEYLLSELKSSGKNGQFRTPRHIIRMMVELVDPDINDTICDPACGSGGFLINAYEYILKKYTSEEHIQIDETGEAHGLVGDKIIGNEKWDKLWKKTFYGFDFDTTMVRIGLMNMILHGIKEPNVSYMDALSKRNEVKPMFNVILANPPFTGSIDASDINDIFEVKTTKTELLFLELFYHQLKVGGRAAVVVPNGVLFGGSNAHKQIRKMLLKNCQLDAVISLPSGVFKPYSGVSTSILVFTKQGENGVGTEKVWFYDMKADGYTLDDKRDFIDGKGDIPEIVENFKNKKEGDNSILVDIKEISDNDYILSYSRYKEVEHEEIEYEDPKVIIDRVLKGEKKIEKELEELRRLV